MAGLNEWLDANTVNAEPFEVEVAGHVFQFRPITNLSVLAKASEHSKQLMDKVNNGIVAEWAKYAPLVDKPALAMACMKLACLDTGENALTDAFLLKMHSDAGLLFNHMMEQFEKHNGYGSDVVDANISAAKND